MPFVLRHLTMGASCELDTDALTVDGRPALAIVRGSGRGCELRIECAAAGVWLPLRGRLQIPGQGELVLRAGEIGITEAEPRQRFVGRGHSIWIGVLGMPAAWAGVSAGMFDIETLLLPAVHRVDRDLRRGVLALARSVGSGHEALALDRVLDDVHSLQLPFARVIARCPGRTHSQRRQVFLRLQRVRNYLATHCHLDVDNDALARMASYSRFHFIRAFGAAYEETPHAYLVRMRLERARRLLHASHLAIGEVALASGFESRCAFSRLFRQRFGTSATAMRRDAWPARQLRER